MLDSSKYYPDQLTFVEADIYRNAIVYAVDTSMLDDICHRVFYLQPRFCFSLVLTSILNGRWVTPVLDRPRTTANSLDRLDNLDRLSISDLAEHDMLAV